jgi:hypothetical protein
MNKESNIDFPLCECPRVSLKQMGKSLAWLAATSALYVMAHIGLKHNPQWSAVCRVGVTLAPLLPGVFYLLSLLQSFRAMDELQRRIQLEAWIIGMAGTVVVNTVLNVLNANGLGLGDYPHGLEIGGVYMSMFLFWSVGVAISTFRYR